MLPILLIVAAVTLYAAIDGLAKVMVQDMDVLQIIWSRFVFALPLLPVIVGRRWVELLDTERPGLQIARGVIPIYVAYRERRLARLSGSPAHQSS